MVKEKTDMRRAMRLISLQLIWVPLFLISIYLSGCASLPPSKTKAFQNSVVAVDTGMQTQLTLISSQIAEGQGERVLSKNPPSLLDTDFRPVLSPAVRSSLMNQVGVLRDYADLLRKVTDRSYRGQFTDAVAKLNTKINESITSINGLSEGKLARLASDKTVAQIKERLGLLSSITTAIGELAIEAYAQHKAKKIVTKYDPHIQDYCHSLQILIDPNPDLTNQSGEVGLVTLTQLAYRQSRNAFAERFEANKPPDEDDLNKKKAFEEEQRRLMTLYRQNIEGEREQVLALEGLRIAIGKIADAHSALAKDEDVDFWAAVNQVADYLSLATSALKLEKFKDTK